MRYIPKSTYSIYGFGENPYESKYKVRSSKSGKNPEDFIESETITGLLKKIMKLIIKNK